MSKNTYITEVVNNLFEIEAHEEKPCINLRTLWQSLKDDLEKGEDYTTWLKRHVKEHDFIEGEDFVSFAPVLDGAKKGRGGHNKKYHLATLTMAKEVCMLARSKKGKLIRRYLLSELKRLQQRPDNQLLEYLKQENRELKTEVKGLTTNLAIALGEKQEAIGIINKLRPKGVGEISEVNGMMKTKLVSSYSRTDKKGCTSAIETDNEINNIGFSLQMELPNHSTITVTFNNN